VGEIIARAVPEAPLAFTGERMTFGAGQEVCHQGDLGDAMYVILGGAAVWPIVLVWKIAGFATVNYLRRFAATVCVALAAAAGTGS
jgi:hypothetical protein